MSSFEDETVACVATPYKYSNTAAQKRQSPPNSGRSVKFANEPLVKQKHQSVPRQPRVATCSGLVARSDYQWKKQYLRDDSPLLGPGPHPRAYI